MGAVGKKNSPPSLAAEEESGQGANTLSSHTQDRTKAMRSKRIADRNHLIRDSIKAATEITPKR